MRKLAIILGCLIYVVFPIDLIPDFIPVAGQADDLGVIVLAVSALLKGKEKGTAA